MDKLFLGYPPKNIRNQIRERLDPQLVFATVDGKECKFDKAILAGKNTLQYSEWYDKTVPPVKYPFSLCAEISSISSLARVSNENQQITRIGSGSFFNCTNLSCIDCPTVTYIDGSGLNHCTALTAADFPNLTAIGNYALNTCRSLTSISFKHITKIPDGAFSSCDSLKCVEFGHLTSIGGAAFSNCSKLTTVIDLSEQKMINASTFQGCKSISAEIWDCSLAETIGDLAFYQCGNVSGVYCPNAKSIGNNSFNNCWKMQKIDCRNATYLGQYAFNECFALSAIILSSVSKVTEIASAVSFCPKNNHMISVYVPEQLEDAFKADEKWSQLTDRIELIGI